MSEGSRLTVVIGSEPLSPDDIEAAKSSDRVLFYSFADACDLEETLGYRGEVVDVSRLARVNERIAGAWARELLGRLAQATPTHSADFLRAVRRRFHVDVCWPLAVACSRADIVRERLEADQRVEPLGLTALEKTALLARSASVPSDPQEAGPPEPGVAARLAVPSHPERTVLVLAAVPVHLKLFRSPLEALHARGWRSIVVQMQPSGDLSDAAAACGSEYLSLTPFLPQVPAEQDLSDDATRRATLAHPVAQWAAENGLAEYAEYLASGLAATVANVERFETAYSALLDHVRPGAVLSVSELYPGIEPIVSAARAHGVATVHVQHGNIPDIARMSDFGYDAFCVFGDAYKEALVRLGTPAANVRVTGSPYMDGATSVSDSLEPVAAHAGFKILFVGGYASAFNSHSVLYESLKMVLEYVDARDDTSLVVKFHPAASPAGPATLAYRVALAEHPHSQVTIVTEGDANELVMSCDCVATRGSSVAFEAAWLRRPVILLNPIGTPPHLPLAEEGVALAACDSGTFAECADKLRSGFAIPDEAYQRVAARYGFGAGGGAGERIADVCEELAGVE